MFRECFTGGGHALKASRSARFGFTLAEVLITLGIIGVVAAMTMPALVANYQKKSLATQTQKFYSMMSQAVKQYMADEGVDDLRNTPLASDNYEDSASPEAIASIRDFVTKYLKVAEECDHDANNCFAEKYRAWNGGEALDNFTTATNYDEYRDYGLTDGSVIRIGYYYGSESVPISLYVDVNGKKGPNRVGYDLWNMDIFYDGVIDESSVGPECRGKDNGEYVSKGLCQGDRSPDKRREFHFESCKDGIYGGCFGHLLNNNFKFDY